MTRDKRRSAIRDFAGYRTWFVALVCIAGAIALWWLSKAIYSRWGSFAVSMAALLVLLYPAYHAMSRSAIKSVGPPLRCPGCPNDVLLPSVDHMGHGSTTWQVACYVCGRKVGHCLTPETAIYEWNELTRRELAQRGKAPK